MSILCNSQIQDLKFLWTEAGNCLLKFIFPVFFIISVLLTWACSGQLDYSSQSPLQLGVGPNQRCVSGRHVCHFQACPLKTSRVSCSILFSFSSYLWWNWPQVVVGSYGLRIIGQGCQINMGNRASCLFYYPDLELSYSVMWASNKPLFVESLNVWVCLLLQSSWLEHILQLRFASG